MRCTNNYEDYLKVTVEDVKRAGFTERYPKRKCGTTYYVKDSCEYVLAITKDDFRVILNKKTYESIRESNIYVNFNKYHNENIQAIPRVNNKKLHRVAIDAEDAQVDHINHHRCCCVEDNLRPCNNKQNTLNRQDKCGVRKYSDIKGTYYTYDLEANGCNKKRYDSMVDCFLGYRDAARAMYNETELKDFVYDIRNDFSETLGLLIHHYILGDITKDEMRQMNLDYWRHKLG